jgi:hypothetical protein
MLTLEAQRELIHDHIIKVMVQYPPAKESVWGRFGSVNPAPFPQGSATIIHGLHNSMHRSRKSAVTRWMPLHSAIEEAPKKQQHDQDT